MVENMEESTKKEKYGKRYCQKYGHRFCNKYCNVLIHYQYLVDRTNGQQYGQECQGIDSFYELLAFTELSNNELTSIHTLNLPPLLL